MSTPKFQSIVDYVVDKIKTGEWEPGHQLPTQADWKEDYGITYGTLRQAYLILKTMNLIEGKQGEGVFVCRREDA